MTQALIAAGLLNEYPAHRFGGSWLVPGEMRENYVVQQTVTINGRATYSRFRQFTVTTTEKSKPQ